MQHTQNIRQILLPNFADYFSDFSILVFSHRRVTTGRRCDGDPAWAAGIPRAALFYQSAFLNELA
jgi:hypothetical protein